MNYKKKNIILLLGVLLSLPALYYTTFVNTLELKESYNDLLKKVSEVNDIHERMLAYKQENKHIDSVLATENIFVDNSFKQILLKKINSYTEKLNGEVEILEFDYAVEVLDNSIKTELYPIVVKGNFSSLLTFLNFFEQESFGEIKSYSFRKKRNYVKRKEYLVLEIILKRVVSN